LLRRANEFYQSGDVGLAKLPLRCALAIKAARLIYAEIGSVIAGRGFDVFAGRAVVSRGRKIWLLCGAVVQTLALFAVAKMGLRADRPAIAQPSVLPFAIPLASATEYFSARASS
ncbi:MAG: squalene/phytoene synthase family protein, partial [Deltaproteobacteria bacterium]|nr:squalene/phytoene synthase family protein [Deltaproteobacteria bacterium]